MIKIKSNENKIQFLVKSRQIKSDSQHKTNGKTFFSLEINEMISYRVYLSSVSPVSPWTVLGFVEQHFLFTSTKESIFCAKRAIPTIFVAIQLISYQDTQIFRKLLYRGNVSYLCTQAHICNCHPANTRVSSHHQLEHLFMSTYLITYIITTDKKYRPN